MMRTETIVLLGFALAGCAPSTTEDDAEATAASHLALERVAAPGLVAPESCTYDEARGVWYASDLGAGRLLTIRHDGAGWRASVLLDGLSHATGLRVDTVTGLLLAVDGSRVLEVDPETGAIVSATPGPAVAQFNDVAVRAASPRVFVSDSFTNRLWSLTPGDDAAELVAEGPALQGTNGLIFDGAGRLLSAGIGNDRNGDRWPDEPAGLISIDVDAPDPYTSIVEEGWAVGILDGLEVIHGVPVASEVLTGKLWAFTPGGAPVQVYERPVGVHGIADFGASADGTFCLPDMNGAYAPNGPGIYMLAR